MNRIVIRLGEFNSTFYTCPCSSIEPLTKISEMEDIPIVYGSFAAIQLGWFFIWHPEYCKDSKAQWICPECVDKLISERATLKNLTQEPINNA